MPTLDGKQIERAAAPSSSPSSSAEVPDLTGAQAPYVNRRAFIQGLVGAAATGAILTPSEARAQQPANWEELSKSLKPTTILVNGEEVQIAVSEKPMPLRDAAKLYTDSKADIPGREGVTKPESLYVATRHLSRVPGQTPWMKIGGDGHAALLSNELTPGNQKATLDAIKEGGTQVLAFLPVEWAREGLNGPKMLAVIVAPATFDPVKQLDAALEQAGVVWVQANGDLAGVNGNAYLYGAKAAREALPK